MTSAQPKAPRGFDLRAAILVPVLHFLAWLVVVLLISFSGYPGVVCVTPLAWLLTLRVGNQVARRSRSLTRARRLTEAAFAGGLLGFLEGVLFGAIAPFMGPVQASEMTNTIILLAVMVVLGTLLGAGGAFFSAYLNENRRSREE